MTDNCGLKIIEAARLRIGLPFRHHFKPENVCHEGTATTLDCMERGMDSEGYDCSGLVIASICDVLGIKSQQWPKEYRHLNQLKNLEEACELTVGDTVLFYQEKPGRTHMGIFVATDLVIHSSGISKEVEESKVIGNIERLGVIPASTLCKLYAKS